ncbi:glycosyltransferase family 25 protein [Psychrobacter jeotgali]|uniref:glycosyltransferase family 25 protein n=1 Tax=Psychrobacter jeotgali TaxID=179010 RepID=UPI001918CFD8|nr:glycosyltransferase family 25 protein [Psychrobacter jeotgali]
MKNIVISLTAATDRRAHIKKEFNKHNVNFEFFDALMPESAKTYANELNININSSQMSSGELACALSHIAVWQRIIDENIAYATIFEDDVYLGDDAKYLLNNTDWIKTDWNIIKIESFDNKVFLSAAYTKLPNVKRQIASLKGKHLGGAGYILSLQGAKLLMDYLLDSELIPIDELIFDKFIQSKSESVYQMTPALCIQEKILKVSHLSLPSSLDVNRDHRMSNNKKTFKTKLTRETRRLKHQFKKSIFAKDIPFK